MGRSRNAQIAVDLYDHLVRQYTWNAQTAWRGVAMLLLNCQTWDRGWQPFHNVVVYREANDFKRLKKGDLSAVLRRANDLSNFLAAELGIARADLCDAIGLYWRQHGISTLQPHNLVGNAFRSLMVAILERFGNKDVKYSEEVDPHKEFPGYEFRTESKRPKLDIVAHKGAKTVALMSARWRFRHDRVRVVEEANSYAPAAHRHNPTCRLYAVTGEFAPNRLEKILTHCPPAHANPALAATVHFAPSLIKDGLGENGRLQYLKGLDWLIGETYQW